MRLFKPVRDWSRRWIRRRQGADTGPVTLHRSRVYILPTGLGVAFAVTLFAMLMGSLNYANNLGLGLTFLLAALGLVAMHACHRNLVGLTVGAAGSDSPFAGQPAVFTFSLDNPSRLPRIDIEVSTESGEAAPVTIPSGLGSRVDLRLPTQRRGWVRLERLEVATRFPFALFRAWAVLHPDARCLVYPRPAQDVPPAPAAPGQDAGSGEQRGEDDFAGLKDYHPGDPPRRIAWKAHARGGELLVKEFAGAASPILLFDLARTPGADLESRLSVMCRWIVDAHAAGQAFGVELDGTRLGPEPGEVQRRRCLAALARFAIPDERRDA